METEIKKVRNYKYEFIRAIAIFAVIGIHVFFLYQPNGTAIRDFSHKFLSTILPTCVAVFFFISGKFAFQKDIKEDEYGTFYFKKITQLFLPVILYMIIYSVYQQYTETGNFTNGLLLRTLVNINIGYNNLHFWFMYTLVGNILFVPFSSKFIIGISQKSAMILIGLGLFFNTMAAYMPYLTGNGFAWYFPFTLWSIYFYIGACYDKIICTKRDEKILLTLGGMCFIFILLKEYFFSYKQFMHDLMPSFTIFSIAIYCLLQKVEFKNTVVQSICRFLGKRSFGIYLVHFLIIWVFMRYFPTNLGIPDLLYFFLAIIYVYLISLATSYLFELIILTPIQWLLERIRTR